jgi:hypothetical protein
MFGAFDHFGGGGLNASSVVIGVVISSAEASSSLVVFGWYIWEAHVDPYIHYDWVAIKL